MERRIVLITFPGAVLLDLAGPADVFATAASLAPPEVGAGSLYRVVLVSAAGGPIPQSNGIAVATCGSRAA